MAEKTEEISNGSAGSAIVIDADSELKALRARNERMIAKMRNELANVDGAAAYLATLQSPQSRKTAIESFRRIARAVGLDADDAYKSIPWEAIDYNFANMIRLKLAESPNLAPRTANLTMAILRGVLKTAWKRGRVPFEQYQAVKETERIGGERIGRGRALKKHEVALLLDFCTKQGETRGVLLKGVLAVMIGAGLRRDETAKLTLSQYKDGALTVIGKRNVQRRIALDPGTAGLLDDWIQERQLLELPHEFIFVTVTRGGKDGRVLKSPLTVWKLWNLVRGVVEDFQKKHPKVEAFSPHDFRRTFASLMLSKGMSLASLQKLMGHKNASTTALYDRRDDEEIADERRKIDIFEIATRRDETRVAPPTVSPDRPASAYRRSRSAPLPEVHYAKQGQTRK